MLDIYDFDGTVYDGDSSVDFWLYCLKKKKSLIIYFPLQAASVLGIKLKLLSHEKGKSMFFSFLKRVDDPQEEVIRFWDIYEPRMADWFTDRDDDADAVVISASPEFLLKPICKKYNAILIATRIDPQTGKMLGKNCKGEEKVRRLNELLGSNFSVRCAYTDDIKSDAPILELAENKIHVEHGKRISLNNSVKKEVNV